MLRCGSVALLWLGCVGAALPEARVVVSFSKMSV